MALFTHPIFDVVRKAVRILCVYFLFSAEAGERVLLNCSRFPFLFFALPVDDEE